MRKYEIAIGVHGATGRAKGHRDRSRDPRVLLETIYSPIVATLYDPTPEETEFFKTYEQEFRMTGDD